MSNACKDFAKGGRFATSPSLPLHRIASENIPAEVIQKALNSPEGIILDCGWIDHSIAIVFQGYGESPYGIGAIVNRGSYRPRGFRPVHSFSFEKSKITPALLSAIRQQEISPEKPENPSFYYETFCEAVAIIRYNQSAFICAEDSSRLGLCAGSNPLKSQTKKNCTYTSLISALFVHYMLRHLWEYDEDFPLSSLAQEARNATKAFAVAFQIHLLRDYLVACRDLNYPQDRLFVEAAIAKLRKRFLNLSGDDFPKTRFEFFKIEGEFEEMLKLCHPIAEKKANSGAGAH